MNVHSRPHRVVVGKAGPCRWVRREASQIVRSVNVAPVAGSLAVGGVVESTDFSLSGVVPRPVEEDDLALELEFTVILGQGEVVAVHTGVLSLQEFVGKPVDQGIDRLGVPGAGAGV